MKKIVVDFISVIFEYAMAILGGFGLTFIINILVLMVGGIGAALIFGIISYPISVIILVYCSSKLRNQKTSDVFQIKRSVIILFITFILICLYIYQIYVREEGPYFPNHARYLGRREMVINTAFVLTGDLALISSWLLVCFNLSNKKLRIFQIIGVLFSLIIFIFYKIASIR